MARTSTTLPHSSHAGAFAATGGGAGMAAGAGAATGAGAAAAAGFGGALRFGAGALCVVADDDPVAALAGAGSVLPGWTAATTSGALSSLCEPGSQSMIAAVPTRLTTMTEPAATATSG